MAHKTNSTSPLFIEVPVPSQESERSSICVLEVSILPISMLFLQDIRTFPMCGIFLFFILFLHCEVSVNTQSNVYAGDEYKIYINDKERK